MRMFKYIYGHVLDSKRDVVIPLRHTATLTTWAPRKKGRQYVRCEDEAGSLLNVTNLSFLPRDSTPKARVSAFLLGSALL